MRNTLLLLALSAFLVSCTSTTVTENTGSVNTGTTVTTTATGTTDTTETMTGDTTQETLTGQIWTLDEISLHTTEADCYTAIDEKVYNVSAFFGKHPGGDQNLFKVCGIDATTIFEKQHGNSREAQEVLAEFQIGTLD